jgi:hypothetical protein
VSGRKTRERERVRKSEREVQREKNATVTVRGKK